jgi:hypothetical protein
MWKPMASSASSSSSGIGSFFSSPTTRRRSSPPNLPTLIVEKKEMRPVEKAVLPTDEANVTREGATAALKGVHKQVYFPPGASRPTALQKASEMLIAHGSLDA